jgi:hypothetical protein
VRSILSMLPRHPLIQIAGALLLAFAPAGCGGSSGTAAAKSEPEARFKGLNSLSAVNTNAAIAEHKKKGLAEYKQKVAASSAPGKQ